MEEKKEIKLDEKVVVKSIAPWKTGATRKMSVGDICIQPNGTINLTREEIISQVQSGNRLFTGIDGVGSHATWYITDDWTRKEVEFETTSKKQEVLSQEEIKRIFDLKNLKSFEDSIRKKIVTRAEKVFLMETILKLQANDYSRIRFCEQYSGNKMPQK